MEKKYSNNVKKTIKKNSLILIIIVIIILFLFIKSNMNKKSDIIYNYKTQVILDNENITSKMQNAVIVENEKVYISYEDIKKFFDDSIYKEESTNTIITIGNNKVVAIKENSDNILINGSIIKENDIFINKDNIEYLSIIELADIYNYEANYIYKTNTIVLNSLNKKSEKANIKNKTNLKEQNKLFSKTICVLQKGEEIYITNENANYTKIRTQSGILGYIKNSKIENKVTEREDFIIERKKISNEIDKTIDITNYDISSFEKREEVINNILFDLVKNNSSSVKINYFGQNEFEYERFKKESVPVLFECGINVIF